MGSQPLAGVVTVLAVGLATAGMFASVADDPGEDSELASTNTSAQDEQDGEREGEMTVERSRREHEGVEPTAPPFYASRVITLEGDLTLEALPVTLGTTTGPIEVRTGADDEFALVANLTGYGPTPEQAREERDELTLETDLGEPGDRQLVAYVEADDADDSSPVSADASRSEGHLELVVPADLALALSADSTNGAVTVADVQASLLGLTTTNGAIQVGKALVDGMQISSTNGAVHVDASGMETASIDTTNGNVDATLRPNATGTIQASSTNGDVDLFVPEDDEHGYQAVASTTNGQASIGLEDGDTDREGRGQVTFETEDFEQRSIRTTITVTSTNGNAHVGPAE